MRRRIQLLTPAVPADKAHSIDELPDSKTRTSPK